MENIKSFWHNTVQYLRILQILFDYWLSEENELYVEVEMTFVHSGGEWQKKRITWFNPLFERVEKEGESDLQLLTLDQIMDPPKIEIPYLDDIKNGMIWRKNNDD